MRPAKRRQRLTGRRECGRFVALPHAVLESDAYKGLSAYARALLVDLALQFNGKNNGDMCATYSVMHHRGWTSAGTVHRALTELRKAGLVMQARVGGRHWASLYALTWLAIDECAGKLDIPSTRTPPGTWKLKSLPPQGVQPPAITPTGSNSEERGTRLLPRGTVEALST